MRDHTPQPFSAQPETKEIPLTQGQVAVVDAADWEYLSQFKWFAHRDGNTFYAERKSPTVDGARHCVLMHREILGVAQGVLVDHRDGDGLNNTRANLRTATRSQNASNKRVRANSMSGVKGVRWDARKKNWRAEIRENGKTKHLGNYPNIEAAALAYDNAARKIFGEFARTNGVIP